MKLEERMRPEKRGVSKVKLAIGAASLFLFIVGLKRTFRTEDGAEVSGSESREAPSEPERRRDQGT